MMKTLIQLFAIKIFILGAVNVITQQGAVPAGGDAQGTTGSTAYSVGQVFYVPVQGEAGRAYPGLQQPNLSAIVATDEPQELSGINVYPNPTHDQLYLDAAEHSNASAGQLSFQLFDVQGKLLLQDQVNQDKSSILMNAYDDGTYVLRVFDKEQKSVSFKIVKTH